MRDGGRGPTPSPDGSGETGSFAGRRRAARRHAGRFLRSATRGTIRVSSASARRIRAATDAKGAGETGLGRLVELQGLSHAGDALFAVALAGTLFFAVPIGEARSRVGLYLLVTMAPFVLLAPVVGPVLDRLATGRRWALTGIFALRALLAWVMADGITGPGDPFRLYPAAFGVLVLGRAYTVTRAAALPRLLPVQIGLVQANGRTQLAGTIGATVAAVLGGGMSTLAGPAVVLRLCAVLMVVGAVLSRRLPAAVDIAVGEMPARMSGAVPDPDGARPRWRARRWNVGAAVVRALRANAALRALSGYLTLFLAFLLREHPLPGAPQLVTAAAVVGGAAVGSAVGTSAGTLLRERRPDRTLLGVLLLVTAACVTGAWLYGDVVFLALVTLAAGFGASLGKLALDAVIQREVPDRVRTSAFARSETLLQLAWVLGGGAGILLPVGGRVGLLVGAALPALALALTVSARTSRGEDKQPTPRRDVSDGPAADRRLHGRGPRARMRRR